MPVYLPAEKREREYGLISNIHGWNIQKVKHYLSRPFSIFFWVKRRPSQKHWMLIWRNFEFLVESDVPNFFHAIPVPDDAVLNRIWKIKNISPVLTLITDIHILYIRANTNIVPRSACDIWKDASGGVFSWEPGLDGPWAVIDDEDFNFFYHLVSL